MRKQSAEEKGILQFGRIFWPNVVLVTHCTVEPGSEATQGPDELLLLPGTSRYYCIDG